jgi:Ca2+-binding RTX toxin-like protein
MTTYVETTVNNPADAPVYVLQPGDNLIVTATGVVVGQDDAPVFISSGNDVRIDGAVYGQAGGSGIWEMPGGGSDLISVGAGGIVHADVTALLLSGPGSRIENAGEISASSRALESLSAIDVVNSGLMSAADTGILIVGAGGGGSEILNTGTIRGLVAIQGGAGVEHVVNQGVVIGDITLGAGADRYDGRLGLLSTWASGDAGADILRGGAGDDDLRGGVDNDLLNGGAGDDTLWGGNGKDTVIGGAGDDQLSGGGKADVFVFRPRFGHDVVVDFAAVGVAHDVIQFGKAAFADFAAVSAAMTQAGADVVIATVRGDDLVLQGVDLGDLDASDFSFVA